MKMMRWAAVAAVPLGLLLAAGPAVAAQPTVPAMYVDGYKTKQDCQKDREWHISQGRHPGPCSKPWWEDSWGFSY
ncbi:hypothetical protein [Pseudonocardia sp. DLS-67]